MKNLSNHLINAFFGTLRVFFQLLQGALGLPFKLVKITATALFAVAMYLLIVTLVSFEPTKKHIASISKSIPTSVKTPFAKAATHLGLKPKGIKGWIGAKVRELPALIVSICAYAATITFEKLLDGLFQPTVILSAAAFIWWFFS